MKYASLLQMARFGDGIPSFPEWHNPPLPPLRPCSDAFLIYRYSSGSIPRGVYQPIDATQSAQAMGANVKPYGHPNAGAGSSLIGRYDAYAPPRRAGPATTAAPSTSSGPPSK